MGAIIGTPMERRDSAIRCVAFSPDGTRIVPGSSDSTLRLWEGVKGVTIGTPMEGHAKRVSCMEFSPDSTRLVSGSSDCTLRLWDAATGASISDPMKDHTDGVNCVVFSPDGTRHVSGSDDGTLWLWGASSCAQLAIIGDNYSIFQAEFSICGYCVISRQRMWDVNTPPPSLVTALSSFHIHPFLPFGSMGKVTR